MNLFRVAILSLTILLVAVDAYGEAAGNLLALLAPALRAELPGLLIALFLFAGALQVRNDGTILPNIRLVILSTLSLALSTLIVAWLVWWLFGKLAIDLPWTWCLLFGALAAPADPVALHRLLRHAGADPVIAGKAIVESVWGSIFAVALFGALWLIETGAAGRAASLSGLIAQHVIGAALLGLSFGLLLVFLLNKLYAAGAQAAASIAVVATVLAIAWQMDLSGPIAAAITGLVAAMARGQWALTDERRDRLGRAWSLLAEGALAILLLWLGTTLAAEPLTLKHATIGILLIPIVIVTRMVAVGLPVRISVLRREFTHEYVRVMAWGGARSAVALALVLSLPPGPETRLLQIMTFMLVAFSLLMQGPLFTLKARTERPLDPETLRRKAEEREREEAARKEQHPE